MPTLRALKPFDPITDGSYEDYVKDQETEKVPTAEQKIGDMEMKLCQPQKDEATKEELKKMFDYLVTPEVVSGLFRKIAREAEYHGAFQTLTFPQTQNNTVTEGQNRALQNQEIAPSDLQLTSELMRDMF